MTGLLYPVFTLAHVLLLIWGLRLYQRSKSWGLLFVILITVGLIYDNLIIAIGSAIGVGSLLETLSLPRYIIHAGLTPLLFMAAYEIASRAGVDWLNNKTRHSVAWAITLVLIVMGFGMGVISAHFKPACYDGTLRYAERVSEAQLCSNVQYTETELNERGLPPIAAILTIVLVGIFSILIGRKTGWWWLLAGAIIMFVGAAIPVSRFGPAIGSGVEIVLIAAMLFTERHLQKQAGVIEAPAALKTA